MESRVTRFPLTYERDARHRAVSRHLENILERSTSLHASCVSLTPSPSSLSIYVRVCVCLHLSPRFGLTQLRVQTTRVNRFAHYKLLTPETLHDEECETIASVKLKRQVVKRRRRKGGDVVRLRKKTSRSSPSYLLLIGSIREMEDRPSPLRLPFSLFPSLSFSLFLRSNRYRVTLHRISLNYRTITFYYESIRKGTRETQRIDRNHA